MTSWVTYARPFVARRNAYRVKADAAAKVGDYGRADRMKDYEEAVAWMWFEFKTAVLARTD